MLGRDTKNCNKPENVHDPATICPSATRIVLSVAGINEFKVFSHDITQAYLPSKNKLTRKIYIQVKPQYHETFGVNENEFQKLETPLYGLCDSGDY